MDLEVLKREVSLLSYIISTGGQVKNIGTGKYRLDPCPVCGHKEHFTIYPDTNTYSSFSSCCKGGTIIDYFVEVEQMPLKDAISKLEGMDPGHEGAGAFKQFLAETAAEEAEKADYSQIIEEAEGDPTGYYTVGRGLSEEIVKQYRLGYLPEGYKGFSEGRRYQYVMPVSDSFVTIRAIRLDQGAKYKNLGKTEILNLHYLKDRTIKEVYITEGIFDALSFESMGRRAIALNSSAMAADLAFEVSENRDRLKGRVLVLAIENDQAGQKVKQQIRKVADNINLRCIDFPMSPYHDANDYLILNREGFEHAIDNLQFRGSMYSYLQDGFELDQKKRLEEKNISTGIDALDNALGGTLYPGLYTIGSVPSLGKTALVMQLAESIAAQQQDVLFFSLEMSRYELTCRSLARILYQNGHNISTGNVLNSSYRGDDLYSLTEYQEALHQLKENFSRYLTIEEGDFVVTMSTIADRAARFQYMTGRKPVLIIDYLQIIQLPEGARLTDKQHVDGLIVALKRLSRELDTPVIAVSSFNRDAYNNPVSFKSFKESGGLEFGADVVMGMQLRDNPAADAANELKNREPRELSLVLLKNRRGRAYEVIDLDYWPRFNHFEVSGGVNTT